MTKRDFIGYLAIVLAAIGGAGLIWYLGFAPHYLRIAIAPPDTNLSRFLSALSTTFERERANVRIQVLRFSTPEAVSQAIAQRRADLAVVRSDRPSPTSTLSVAAFQEFITMTLARADANVGSFGDLAGKRVAIAGSEPGNRTLFASILRLHGIPAADVRMVDAADAAEVAELTEKKQIDAVFVVAPRGSPIVRNIYDRFADALDKPPVLVALGDFKNRLALSPAFAKAEIGIGEIRATTPRVPEKPVRTISFPALLVARNALQNTAVLEFTRNLFAYRLSLATRFPVAARLTALPTKRDSPFPLHPGAAIYYDASEVSFLEKYSDLLWLALFGASGIASILVWLWRLATPRTQRTISAERSRLAELINQTRDARSPQQLDSIQREADSIVVAIASQLYDGTIDAASQPSFDLLLARLNGAIETQRDILKTSSAC
ncbi:MAG: ABC transporter substrate-binding protein [Hyphomicrobiales bacterium]|nr:ABC transporter substrate-binding protein [Hyphomicrobiales bacterium]